MVLLGKSYGGYAAGAIVQLATSLEAALVAQGVATVSAGPVTPGAVTTDQNSGRVGIAAAGSSVVVTNPKFTSESMFACNLTNAAADSTALYITRVVKANGSVTFVLNAAATAAVAIDWQLITPQGLFAAP